MNDIALRRFAWGTAFFASVILLISATMLFLAPDRSSYTWFGNLGSAIVALGAPILGVVIVTRQPRNRIGWLWIIYGVIVGLRSLGHAIYYFGDSQPVGYSPLEYFLLWLTEPTNLATIICPLLLLLWFPDGQLPSRRWRFLYFWLFLALAVLFLSLFESGPNWNGGADAGGIIIDNPYGWLPANTTYNFGFPAFLSIVLIMILAAVSLIFRYRSAGQLVRLQLRWFVMGGILFVILEFLPVFTIDQIGRGFNYLLLILGQAAIIPLYLAVGMAILRYRLYDIDVIIRRTVQYTLLTGLLVLVYFGSVVLLQSLAENLIGEQSPLVIVFSTLVIAALFNPLRRRVQDFIDRRFYRKKYDAEQALARFATTARDEVDMDQLNAALLQVVEQTMQPESVSLWLQQWKK
jgi:hypothetical protein